MTRVASVGKIQSAAGSDDVERVYLRLNHNVPAERKILEAYRSVPRARRGEWIRRALELGCRELGAMGLKSGTTKDRGRRSTDATVRGRKPAAAGSAG